MTGTYKSKDRIKSDGTVYESFRGIDRSRDRAAMDTGKKQHLWVLNNGYSDWRGRIVKDPNAIRRKSTGIHDKIQTVKFYSRDGICWAQKDGGGVSLLADSGAEKNEIYPTSAVVDMTVFKGELLATTKNQPMYLFNGTSWRQSSSIMQPAYSVAVEDRLIIAGLPGAGTEVHMSEVGKPEKFPLDTDADSQEVTQAYFIDLANKLGTAETVTGLGTFETNRLAIFTQERALLYKIDASIEKITLDENANLRVGCISHRTIQNANTQLLFCSRYGVHAMSRTYNYGIYVTSNILSDKVQKLYKSLVKSVKDPEQISAIYDQDNYQYHIFFPQNDQLAKRLTLTMRGPAEVWAWSTGDALYARCGDALGGQLVFGTPGGVFNILDRTVDYKGLYDKSLSEASPKLEVWTPILWHGSAIDYKESKSVIIQAAGTGTLDLVFYDEVGRKLHELSVQIEDTGDDEEITLLTDAVLRRQYDYPFEARYRGLQIYVSCETPHNIEVMGIAIQLKQDT